MIPVNDNHKKPGIKRPYFPLPSVPEPENYQCVQLSIPDNDDYRVALISALQMLTYWFNWQRDEAKTGTIVASVWREVVEHMSFKNACCCGGEIAPETRYTTEGTLEVFDTTTNEWRPYPEGDPRERSTQFPPLPGPDGSTKRCMAAENIVAVFESNVDQLVSDLALYTSIAAFALAVGGMVAVYLSLGALLPAVTALATAAYAAGASGISAAFTSDVWDRFKCNLYCHMQATGKVGISDIAAIKAQVEEDETGIASTILRRLIDNYGTVGMNNLASTESAGDGDTCGDCFCADLPWCVNADFGTGEQYGFTSTGTWDGTGWLNTEYSGILDQYRQYTDRLFTLTTGSRVTGVTMYFTDLGRGGCECLNAIRIGGLDGQEPPYQETGNFWGGGGSMDGLANEVQYDGGMYIAGMLNGTASGDVKLTRMVIAGTGDKPVEFADIPDCE